jgi:ABC-type transporter Mla maintaining outer membrane lipid asymmetry ATPase subunit MlaF
MVVVLRNVEKSFGRLRVLNGVELEVGKGEYFVVLGPSGEGKSRPRVVVRHLHDYHRRVEKRRQQ